MKIKRVGNNRLMFFCPACDAAHSVYAGIGGWAFNGDFSRPTLTPSVLVNRDQAAPVPVCHSFVRDGRIEYLSDCTHALAGKVVDMVDVEDKS